MDRVSERLFMLQVANMAAKVVITQNLGIFLTELFQPEAFTELARRIKLETPKNIWCYTGFTFQKILRNPKLSAILPYIDVLVDGQFIEKKKVANLPFVGSSNQRIINVKESLKANKMVEWKNPFLF